MGRRGPVLQGACIFAGFRPLTAVGAALLFGCITALGFVGQARNWPVAPAILSMLPYLGTIGLIIVPAIALPRIKRYMAAPRALGQPYFQDMR